MIYFNNKIVILGCGSVAQSVLPILLKLIKMPPKNILIIDINDRKPKIANFIQQGVQFLIQKITQDNYEKVLSDHLTDGDFLLDLSWNIDTCTLLDWCHHRNVKYLNTSVEVWDPYKNAREKSPSELTLYHRHMNLRKMIASWDNRKGPTAVVEHGANPGLVSHFTKKALLDIAEHILQKLKIDNSLKQSLEKGIADENFPLLAYLENIKTIHISERDSQITSAPKKFNEFVNTWSVEGLMEEGIAPTEIGWGTHEKYLPKGTMFHQEGPKNQILLPQKGVKTWVRSWVPSGDITGMVIRHGESFSISDYLTLWQDGKAIYRPTVHYAYCPCDSAINSLHEFEMRHFTSQDSRRILQDEIIDGKDELGCLLMGHPFKSWWTGSVLDIHEARRHFPNQNATTAQVAIGIVAAMIYAINNPLLGVCVPDQLDHKQILKIAIAYLGQFISMPVSWSPLDYAVEVSDYNEKVPDVKDVWQFKSFIVSNKESFYDSGTVNNVEKELQACPAEPLLI